MSHKRGLVFRQRLETATRARQRNLLREAMNDRSPWVRCEALDFLKRAPRMHFEELVLQAARLSRSRNAIVRLCAFDALIAMKRGAAAALPLLLRRRDLNPKRAEALWAISRNAESVLPLLRKVIRDDPEAACDIVSEMRGAAAELLPELLKLLESNDYDLLWAVADAVGALKSKAAPAVPQLVALLDHRSGVVAGSAAQALAAIGRKSVPAIIRKLETGRGQGREFAADALATMGVAARAAVPALGRVFKRAVGDEKLWIGIALACVTQQFQPAGPLLLRNIDHDGAGGRVRKALEVVRRYRRISR